MVYNIIGLILIAHGAPFPFYRVDCMSSSYIASCACANILRGAFFSRIDCLYFCLGKRMRQRVNKDTVTIHNATMEDCYRHDGLNLTPSYIRGVNTNVDTLRIPDNFPAITADDSLCEALLTARAVWRMNSELDCRILTNLILTDVLRSVKGRLSGCCNVSNDYEADGVAYSGDVDYLIGSWERTDTSRILDANVLVVRAESDWPDPPIAHVICHAGCLLKRRLALGKKTPVYAVMATGSGLFEFILLDVDGTVYNSRVHYLHDNNDGGFRANVSVVLRWIQWFLTSPKAPPVIDTQPRTPYPWDRYHSGSS